MPARFSIFSLADFSRAPTKEVGSTAKLLASLWQQGVPIPPMICIPTSILKQLAQNPQLHLKIEQLQRSRSSLHHTELTERVKYLLSHYAIDKQFMISVSHHYHDYLGANHTCVYLSDGLPSNRKELILGDANLVHAITQVWAQAIVTTLLKSPKHHTVEMVVAPSAIIVSQQPQPLASGTVYTKNPVTNDKTQLYISSVWGELNQAAMQQAAQTIVDVRTNTVVQRKPHKQITKFIYGSSELVAADLSQHELSHTPIDDAEALAIARFAIQLKRQTLEHLTVNWVKSDSGFYLTGISEIEATHTDDLFETPPNSATTLTKLFITGGNEKKAAEQVSQAIDGIGLLKSEYCLAKFGMHPEHLLQSHQRDTLRQSILQTIKTYQSELPGKLILFRTENFTSAELLKLKYSSSYTEPEENPLLGVRGGYKYLLNPNLFTFQLAVLKEAVNSSHAPLGLVIPYVRNSNECTRILQYVTEAQIHTPQFAGVWLQLNTPENILQLTDYPLNRLAGVVINVSSILALATGTDPDNAALTQEYEYPLALLETFLAEIKNVCTQHPKLRISVYFRQYHPEAVAAAVRSGVYAITVRPNVASVAKVSIMEAETSLFSDHSKSAIKKEFVWQ